MVAIALRPQPTPPTPPLCGGWAPASFTLTNSAPATLKDLDAKPKTEAAFKRKREHELRDIEAANRQAGHQRPRLCGTEIPDCTHIYANAHHEKIRSDAAMRGASFQKGKTDDEIVKCVDKWDKQKADRNMSKWVKAPPARG